MNMMCNAGCLMAPMLGKHALLKVQGLISTPKACLQCRQDEQEHSGTAGMPALHGTKCGSGGSSSSGNAVRCCCHAAPLCHRHVLLHTRAFVKTWLRCQSSAGGPSVEVAPFAGCPATSCLPEAACAAHDSGWGRHAACWDKALRVPVHGPDTVSECQTGLHLCRVSS